jgi:hypothetical protein
VPKAKIALRGMLISAIMNAKLASNLLREFLRVIDVRFDI